jgi:serine O-acetyltransferase
MTGSTTGSASTPLPGFADALWPQIQTEARRQAAQEPLLASYLHATVIRHAELEDSLSFLLADKLASNALPAPALREVIGEALAADPAIGAAVRADLGAVRTRDPACLYYLTPLLYFKGFHALQSHRIAHWLWRQQRQSLALFLASQTALIFAVDIHPAARFGQGVMIDHATGVVVGETAVVGDDVSLLQGVTLGGTGKDSGDRHPKVRAGVLIGAGAKILGNIEIGEGARIGAGSVVLRDVPPGRTAVGVPARIVGQTISERPAFTMDHRIDFVSG